jgi:hypothetical protein
MRRDTESSQDARRYMGAFCADMAAGAQKEEE